MATKRVYVYKDGEVLGVSTYKVYPAVTILKKNDSIELVNTTDDEAEWVVPAGLLDTNEVKDRVQGKKSKSLEAKKDGPLAGQYQVKFGVFRAHANSDPVIIIDL